MTDNITGEELIAELKAILEKLNSYFNCVRLNESTRDKVFNKAEIQPDDPIFGMRIITDSYIPDNYILCMRDNELVKIIKIKDDQDVPRT